MVQHNTTTRKNKTKIPKTKLESKIFLYGACQASNFGEGSSNFLHKIFLYKIFIFLAQISSKSHFFCSKTQSLKTRKQKAAKGQIWGASGF